MDWLCTNACKAFYSCPWVHISFHCPCQQCIVKPICEDACSKWSIWYDHCRDIHIQVVSARNPNDKAALENIKRISYPKRRTA